ncbi:bifunctional 3'-5' exonuclease/DNA polymerase [Carbonactinospora thermoautotrophica]|uniref:bifunctional 3'-5' exonuclease/DNA polymerase n=1 Tax=Carbonactinospora thermoautotrophica TaxID=1469144 RepID=UPI00227181D6|nr:bifunctional 3'-5' exonuclease/DNA polymerase [Carbonactinospora thermoautotrophica]
MRIAVTSTWGGGGWLQPLAEDGAPAGPAEHVTDLAAAVRDRERAHRPRWVWAATEQVYPALLEAGVRVARCHDLALVEALLLAYTGRFGEPRSLGAAWARLRGLPVPDDPRPGSREAQPALFEPDRSGLPPGVTAIEAVREVYAAQLRALATAEHPLRLLAAAESAGALAAAEMTHEGLPWRADVHDALLTELLGPRPPAGAPPARLAELAARINAAFGGRRVNPDSPAQVMRAFAAEGLSVPSTRSHVLRGVDHPAVPLLLEYKELSRLYTAHGWAWLDTWVKDGRFRPEYVVGGVVSGRWATRGGGALQIPRALRRAVIADPGWVLVVADAGQLEPRVLAALSGDRGLAEAAGTGDLYAALAATAFDGDRARAKIALLAAMYGQTSGEAGHLLGVLRRRFPDAVEYVESAARAGEEGRLVRSRLGRTCPPPSAAWQELVSGSGPDEAGERRAGRAARSRGRFTRNFVVQASAADWALVLLAALRRRLAALATGPHLVFFQHDEVVVHCPRPLAGEVTAAVAEAGAEARRLVFGDTPVRFPLDTAAVDCYADAK